MATQDATDMHEIYSNMMHEAGEDFYDYDPFTEVDTNQRQRDDMEEAPTAPAATRPTAEENVRERYPHYAWQHTMTCTLTGYPSRILDYMGRSL